MHTMMARDVCTSLCQSIDLIVTVQVVHTHSSSQSISQSGRRGRSVVRSWCQHRACCQRHRQCVSRLCVPGRTWCCLAASVLLAACQPSAARPSDSPVIGRSLVMDPSPWPAATARQTSVHQNIKWYSAQQWHRHTRCIGCIHTLCQENK